MGEDADAGATRGASRRTRPPADRRGSIPARLNYLFATVHAPGAKPYFAADAARWIQNKHGADAISSVYINKILSGERLEPSPRYLHLLAEFFGVKSEFFLESDPPELDGAELDAKMRRRSDKVESMIRRMTMLSPGQLSALSDIIDSLLRAEGKDPYAGINGDAAQPPR
jgi:transcriptional regulator with XRE-family HTH domain